MLFVEVAQSPLAPDAARSSPDDFYDGRLGTLAVPPTAGAVTRIAAEFVGELHL